VFDSFLAIGVIKRKERKEFFINEYEYLFCTHFCGNSLSFIHYANHVEDLIKRTRTLKSVSQSVSLHCSLFSSCTKKEQKSYLFILLSPRLMYQGTVVCLVK